MVRAAATIDGLERPVDRAVGRRLPWRYIAPGLSLVAYAALFPPLYAVAGTAAPMLSTIPVVLVAAVTGARLGLAAAILAVLVNMAYVQLLGGIGFALLSRPGGILGSVALVIVGGTVGFVRGATARANEARDANEATFHALFDRAPIGLARLDLQGRVVEANATLRAVLGLDEHAADHPPLGSLIVADDDSQELDYFAELRLGVRDSFRAERRFARDDGSLVWACFVITTIRDAAGQPDFFVAAVHDISEQREQKAALEHQALHDALTGLPNRVLLMDRLQQAIRHADGDLDRLALLVMDLDRFKVVNDTMGHDVGDALLQDVGERVRKQVRDPDTVARLGGDEFAVLLPLGGDATIATIVAHKILRALEHPYELDGQHVTIGASIGIALFPKHGDAATTLLRRADVAMYAAKRDRSGYAIYTESFDDHLGGNLSLAADLHLAIERRQLYLEYQPVAELPTGEIKQVEALVRWRHPDRGILMPNEFIGLAEETGLIKALTDWVVSAALGQCGRWRQRNLDVSISINVPTPMLQSSFFLHTLEGHLGSLDLDPACLTLEVTETTLMREPDYSVQLLDRLRAMGVRLCIDDFGTGYSSLSHLQQLEVHELKIDRSFIRDLKRAPGDVAIVRSTIDLAHRLGLRVVAEGVEDGETWRHLCELGCDAAQGFLISPSLEAGEAPRWLVQQQADAAPPEA